MTDCFITSNLERKYLAKITLKALSLNGECAWLVNAPMLDRYFECESKSRTGIYILSDDDIIPAREDSIKNLVKILEERPEYGIIGLSWKPNLKAEEVSGWLIKDEGDVLEMDHVGGIMAIRKGVLEDLGERCDYENGTGDDKVIGRIIRKKGYKVGLYIKDYFHHLGAGNSTVWK